MTDTTTVAAAELYEGDILVACPAAQYIAPANATVDKVDATNHTPMVLVWIKTQEYGERKVQEFSYKSDVQIMRPDGDSTNRVSDLITRIREIEKRKTAMGSFGVSLAPPLLALYQQLVAAIQLRAYRADTVSDGLMEQVVVTVHGIDVSIRGRTDDLFVHVDTTERDQDEARRFPLVVEVNDSGEQQYD